MKTVEFTPTPTIRRIAISPDSQVWEITDMFDRGGNSTDDPALCSVCVLRCGDTFVHHDADDIPIYTVH